MIKKINHPIRICNDCGKSIYSSEMYFINIPHEKVLYWHTECYKNSEALILENKNERQLRSCNACGYYL